MNKLIVYTLLLLGIVLSQPASSNLFTFSQGGFEDDATVTGSFTGEDLNNDGILTFKQNVNGTNIETGEVTSFNMNFSGNSIIPAYALSFPFPDRLTPGPPSIFSNMIYQLDGGPLGDNPIEGILIFGSLDPVFGIDFPTHRYGTGSALFKDCGSGGFCGDVGISGVPSGQSSSINQSQITYL